MIRSSAIVLCFVLLSASIAHADDVAKYVTAEEITGVVVEDSGKPIAGAVVAIKFVRNNTGHSGEHCFRSMAVEADAQGRFRFAPWTQENTRADGTYGELAVYKSGYSNPVRPTYVAQSRRSFLGIAFSDTIRIPKTDVRLEMKPFVGSDEARMQEIERLASNFACRMQAYFDDMVLLTSVRDEIASSPIANQGESGHYSHIRWINEKIKDSTDPRMPNIRTDTHEKK
ncbi:MAG TPA: carboxypeptidase-like regulatory domain-containing protein [Burkholderiales bacterium]|nr:carboxypeptidase-like regulatory domain-containing protein [Burkholderiales bacterium]